MQLSIKGLIEAGLPVETVARLAGLSGTQADVLMRQVSDLAVDVLRVMIESRPSIDAAKPDRHVFTVSGQIQGLKCMPKLIEEAGQWLRETQREEGAPP